MDAVPALPRIITPGRPLLEFGLPDLLQAQEGPGRPPRLVLSFTALRRGLLLVVVCLGGRNLGLGVVLPCSTRDGRRLGDDDCGRLLVNRDAAE